MKKVFFMLFVLILMVSLTQAQEEQMMNPQVEEIAVCTSVEDRQPVGADSSFTATVEQLYCFNKVTGAGEGATISHVWYHGDKEMASVDLNVQGDSWRTWSSKRIVPEWTGDWRVDVKTADGTVLKSIAFKVE